MDLDREGEAVDMVEAPDREGVGDIVVRAEPLLATRLVTVVVAAERVAVAEVERVVVADVERVVLVVEVLRDVVELPERVELVELLALVELPDLEVDLLIVCVVTDSAWRARTSEAFCEREEVVAEGVWVVLVEDVWVVPAGEVNDVPTRRVKSCSGCCWA